MIKLAIVDDKQAIRNAMKSGLERFGNCEVVFTAENGKDFLEQMREARRNIEPDLVLMDIDMPLMNGIEAVAAAKQRYPNVLFIMLTIFDEDDKIFSALKAGADGYLLKDTPLTEIRRAILDVINGLSAPMSPSIARKVFSMLKRSDLVPQPIKPEPTSSAFDLSEREMEILMLLVDGLEYKEIGSRLDISPNTVRNHITRIYRKLHVTSRSYAVKIAASFMG
jgi:DNA-binding NarL/FixJ family response regulator